MWRELDIDNLLAEEDRISCEFLEEGYEMGSLDPNLHQVNLPSGSIVELPLWLGVNLSKKDMVKINVPKRYGKKMINAIEAGSGHLNFKEFSPYFYEAGIRIADATQDEVLRSSLQSAICGERFRSILSHSFTSSNDDSIEFSQKLTVLELDGFKAGLDSFKEFTEWRRQRAPQVKKSSMLATSTKRSNSNRSGINDSNSLKISKT